MDHVAIIVILIIIVIAIILLALLTSQPGKTQSLNMFCDSVNACQDGLTCQNNACKANINNSCQVLSDCVNTATACFNGTCSQIGLGQANQTPPCQANLVIENGVCKVPIGGECSNLSQCVNQAGSCTAVNTSTICVLPDNNTVASGTVNAATVNTEAGIINELVDRDGVNRFPNLPAGILDITTNDSSIFILLSNNHVVEINDSGRRIHPANLQVQDCDGGKIINENLSLRRILFFQQNIYAISNESDYNRLYRLCQRSQLIWRWRLIEWAPHNIVYADVTYDGFYLWLQTAIADDIEAKYMGYYYACYNQLLQPTGTSNGTSDDTSNGTNNGMGNFSDNVRLLSTVKNNYIRKHGRTKHTFLQFDSDNQIVYRYPAEDLRENVIDAVLLHNGEMVILDNIDSTKYQRILRMFDNIYYLSNNAAS